MIFKAFWRSRQGNFATMFGIALIPLLLGAGMAVDYSRYMSAKSHLQELADAAALGAAAAALETESEVRSEADRYVQANYAPNAIDSVSIADARLDGDTYTVDLSGSLKTTFMGIANIGHLDVDTTAVAVRGVNGSVEVALVLDNTWSMSADAGGESKIGSLKKAAGDLVTTLHEDEDTEIKIAVVPYADYVNVGTEHAGESWLDIEKEYSKTSPRSCWTQYEKNTTCKVRTEKYSCSSTTDGITTTGTCGGGCAEWNTEKLAEPIEHCSGPTVTNYEWHGCVGSRTLGDLHLSDESPSSPYPGFVTNSQKCLNPIVPLTTDEAKLHDAVDKMIVNIGNYKPETYIPAGLVWGLNVLSPSAPFTEGASYDADNQKPRKVMVLMTDGENTLRFNAKNGKHPEANAGQKNQTDKDALAICENVKAKDIEIYTVAFGVESVQSKQLLQDCATDAQHYFDATDSAALKSAFSDIAESLQMVRLAR